MRSFNAGANYKLERQIGQGGYGSVVAALHLPTGRRVAIKRVVISDNEILALRAVRELKISKFLTDNRLNDHVVSLLDFVYSAKSSEVYLVQELMQQDLHAVLQLYNLDDEHHRLIISQILRALKSIHSVGIIHRDIKPANVLLDSSLRVKLCDFGLARGANEDVGNLGMTEYVVTRWYRAPEIMIFRRLYSKAIDIWAVGCILAELLIGMPLFPGKTHLDQLCLILDYFDIGPTEPSLQSKPLVRFLSSRVCLMSQSRSLLLEASDSSSYEFLSRMLTFAPEQRMTAMEALSHPYLSAYSDPGDSLNISPPGFSFNENEGLTKEDLKAILSQEAERFDGSIH
ncbi:hypothetical protein HGRIS_001235 [Hohenbuehelia grisea]|uniref:Protein kinase domain-containing protein n=1 Tax=Hohenbuehelia grisea TaxID=104357 RepID=A0ABR3JNP2_9AGAR